jgi:hypothetical protein
VVDRLGTTAFLLVEQADSVLMYNSTGTSSVVVAVLLSPHQVCIVMSSFKEGISSTDPNSAQM